MTPSRLLASACTLSLVACGASRPRPMALRRVILYQNGIGYFERSGVLKGNTLQLTFARPELDDVLKTLTVIDKLGAASVATVDVPTPSEKAKTMTVDVRMASKRVHDLLVGYAVPQPTWKAAYRVVLDDTADTALLQGWAMINNTSQEDWAGIQLTLATGAPMSFQHDLHTPQYVARPDVTGRMVQPTVLGPVGTEISGAVDNDRDGIMDVDDHCPDSAEDRDGFSDEDGCPDSDSDGDRISDADDRCPTEAESYNGTEDDDGCPDRGRVVLTSTSIEILEAVMFAKDSDLMGAQSAPVVAAVAQTLAANPDIVLIEIGGHASADEAQAFGLAERRAHGIRQALIARGIAPSRLETVGYAATQPRDKGTTSTAAAKNRRVEFLILKRSDRGGPVDSSYVRITPQTAAASTYTKTVAATVAGTVRYVLGEPVTVKRGGSTMVSILNKPIAGKDILLFRPDGNAPGSDRHPFRAVRLQNGSGFTLEPGPIAIFAGGSFVGDTLLERLQIGQTSWIPYALDGGTTVTVASDSTERPVRLLAMQRGVMTVENAGVRSARYTIGVGLDTARTIYLRHPKTSGYTPSDLPPATQDQGDAYLIPVAITPGKTTTFTVEEREARRRTVALLDANKTDLGVYLEGTKLTAELSARMAEAIAARKEMGAIEEDIAALRGKIADLAQRTQELRENLESLAKVRGADNLKKQLIASLTAAAGDADLVARQIAVKTEALAAARNKLQLAIRELTLTPDR